MLNFYLLAKSRHSKRFKIRCPVDKQYLLFSDKNLIFIEYTFSDKHFVGEEKLFTPKKINFPRPLVTTYNFHEQITLMN